MFFGSSRMRKSSRLARLAAALVRCRRGLALTEFAYATPLFVLLGMTGMELANYALASLRISQVASNVADVVSRTGQVDGLGVKTIEEGDIDDAFGAVAVQAGNLDLEHRGRVILSSLEQNDDGGQWIHWQRCFGARTDFDSSYGDEGDGRHGTALPGMGSPGAQVTAPDSGSAVMFVEVQYDYQPLISLTRLANAPRVIKAKAAFLVRDRRDLSNGKNPKNTPTKPKMQCH